MHIGANIHIIPNDKQTSFLFRHIPTISNVRKENIPQKPRMIFREQNKPSPSDWAQRFVAEPVGMCGTLMFLMKSTELHWSTGDESELSKAIRQVKDPLSALCSWSERDTTGAQEQLNLPRQTLKRRGTHADKLWCLHRVKGVICSLKKHYTNNTYGLRSVRH